MALDPTRKAALWVVGGLVALVAVLVAQANAPPPPTPEPAPPPLAIVEPPEGPPAAVGDPALAGVWRSQTQTAPPPPGPPGAAAAQEETRQLKLRRDGRFFDVSDVEQKTACQLHARGLARGTWKAAQGTLALAIESGDYESTDSCNAAAAKRGSVPPSAFSYTYAVGEADGGRLLKLTDRAGNTTVLHDGP